MNTRETKRNPSIPANPVQHLRFWTNVPYCKGFKGHLRALFSLNPQLSKLQPPQKKPLKYCPGSAEPFLQVELSSLENKVNHLNFRRIKCSTVLG